MRWITVRRGQEEGAVAVIVALVAFTLVLTGVAALTIDAGSLYSERRVVQNAADAGSLALAQACAKNDAACTPSFANLTTLANLNSPDDLTDIDSVCGSTSPFTSCESPPSPLRLVDCTTLPTIPATAKWVEVRTKTRSTYTANPAVVHKYFANLFSPSYDGTNVRACARAAWGPAGGLQTIVPVTFSLCEWKLGTTTGTAYGNKPPFTAANPETPAREVGLALNAPNDAACATWAGHDLPGGFGWLCHGSACIPASSTSCSIAVDGNGWVDVDSGEGKGNDCSSQMTLMVSTVVNLPIFDCMSKTKNLCDNTANGTKSFYHIKGYAAFFVTGVDINGQMKEFRSGYPTTAAQSECTAKGGKCIYGWFLKDFLSASAVLGSGSSDLGLTIVQLVG